VQSQIVNSIQTCEYSGSTACVLIVHGHKLITANVGNSRAIAVDKFRKVRTLTEVHLPSVAAERKRIEKAGGKIALTTPPAHS